MEFTVISIGAGLKPTAVKTVEVEPTETKEQVLAKVAAAVQFEEEQA